MSASIPPPGAPEPAYPAAAEAESAADVPTGSGSDDDAPDIDVGGEERMFVDEGPVAINEILSSSDEQSLPRAESAYIPNSMFDNLPRNRESEEQLPISSSFSLADLTREDTVKRLSRALGKKEVIVIPDSVSTDAIKRAVEFTRSKPVIPPKELLKETLLLLLRTHDPGLENGSAPLDAEDEEKLWKRFQKVLVSLKRGIVAGILESKLQDTFILLDAERAQL